MEWYTATRIVCEVKGFDFYQARELITIINKEKKDKGYYIPNMYQVPKEWLEQRLGFKIKNA